MNTAFQEHGHNMYREEIFKTSKANDKFFLQLNVTCCVLIFAQYISTSKTVFNQNLIINQHSNLVSVYRPTFPKNFFIPHQITYFGRILFCKYYYCLYMKSKEKTDAVSYFTGYHCYHHLHLNFSKLLIINILIETQTILTWHTDF